MTITAELPPCCLVCGRQIPPQRPPYPPTCLTHAKRNWIHPGWLRLPAINVARSEDGAA